MINLKYKKTILHTFERGTTKNEILKWCNDNLLQMYPPTFRTKDSFYISENSNELCYENCVTFTKFKLYGKGVKELQ